MPPLALQLRAQKLAGPGGSLPTDVSPRTGPRTALRGAIGGDGATRGPRFFAVVSTLPEFGLVELAQTAAPDATRHDGVRAGVEEQIAV